MADAGLKFAPGDVEGLTLCMKRVLDQPSLAKIGRGKSQGAGTAAFS